MAGLMPGENDFGGLLGSFEPSQADKDQALKLAKLQFFLGMMGAHRGSEFSDIANSGINAINGYNNSLNDFSRRRQQNMASVIGALNAREAMQKFSDSQAARKVAQDFYSQQGMVPGQPTSGLPAGSVGGDGYGPPTPSGGVPQKTSVYKQYAQLADAYDRAGLPDYAQHYRDLAEKARPKLKDTKTLTQNGQRVTVNFYDDGSTEVVPFSPDQEKLHFADTGSSVQGLDQFTGNPVGAAVPKTMTPGEMATNTLGVARLGEEQRHNRVTEGQGNFSQPFEATVNGQPQLVVQDKRTNQLLDPNTRQPITTAQPKDALQLQNQKRGVLEMADRVGQLIDKATPNIGKTTTGFPGAVVGKIPGTSAYDLRATVDSIRANLGFEQLQQLRNASPTGGALGQVSDFENRLLASTVANLDANQSEPQLRANLAEVKKHLDNVRKLIAQNGGVPSAAGGNKTVVRTGTDRATGKRVVQYSDGSVQFAPQ